MYRIGWPPLILHVQSTMRMGLDPANSVLDSNAEARAVKRLFIADNAALPNGIGGPNPTLTTQAVATRTAEKIFKLYFGGDPWVGREAPISSIDDVVTAAVLGRAFPAAPPQQGVIAVTGSEQTVPVAIGAAARRCRRRHRGRAAGRSCTGPRARRGVSRPLDGVRVIDAGTRIAAPFCAGLLGEFGAEVIKVEQPGTGDFMRTIGPFVPTVGRWNCGVLPVLGGRRTRSQERHVRFAAAQGSGAVQAPRGHRQCPGRELPPRSDGGLERRARLISNPDLVYVRISAFGQDGPYAQRPGLDRMGIAYGGLMHLTGYPDRPPVRVGVTLSDYLTGAFAASAASAALYAGRGAVIDACLYGSALRILEWTLAAYDALGTVRTREGNRLANSAPLDNYPTKDGKHVCIVAGSDTNFARLCRAMGRPELITDERYKTLADRAANGEELNDLVAAWTQSMTADDVEAACIAGDVPVATVYSATDIFADPHIAARGDLVTVDDPVVGPLRQQAPVPRIDGAPAPTPTGAPRLGEHNQEVWGDLLGIDAAELAALQADAVI